MFIRQKNTFSASQEAQRGSKPASRHSPFYLTVCHHIGRAVLKAPERQLQPGTGTGQTVR